MYRHINNCKCGSNRIMKCYDKTVSPTKYWIECLDCGFIGGIIFSNQIFSMVTKLQDGTEIIESIESPEKDSIDLWNKEVENIH